jgi:hypothetical protein
MPAFETITCNECGEAFRALDGANAAVEGYCSPTCVKDGKNLR